MIRCVAVQIASFYLPTGHGLRTITNVHTACRCPGCHACHLGVAEGQPGELLEILQLLQRFSCFQT